MVHDVPFKGATCTRRPEPALSQSVHCFPSCRGAETLFPQDAIHRVCYFTARLDARPGNPGQAQGQLIYLRALAVL